MRKRLMLILLSAALASTALAVTAAPQSDWASFWRKFKTAVAAGDKATILSLSSATNLPQDYQALFGSRARRRCFSKAKPVKDEQGYSVFCGEQGYYFRLVDGQYKFVESFAND